MRDYLWILGVILLLYFVVKTVVRYRYLVKVVKRMNGILYVEKNPDGYIKECDRMMIKMAGRRNRDINLLQKATGLFYAGRFSEAEDVLLNQLKEIPPNGQGLYYQNLILSKFFSGNIDEGHQCLIDNKGVLKMYENAKDVGDGIEFIFATDDLFCGDFQSRKTYFAQIGENGRNDYRRAMGYYCLGLLLKKEDDKEKMKEAFHKAIEIGKNSFAEKLSIKELEEMGELNEN